MASPAFVVVMVGLGIAAFFYYLYAADGPREENYQRTTPRQGDSQAYVKRRGSESFRSHNSSAGTSASETCTICLSTCAIGRKIQLVPCKHVFHLDCIKEWRYHGSNSYSDQHYLCPNCRCEYSNPGSHFK